MGNIIGEMHGARDVGRERCLGLMSSPDCPLFLIKYSLTHELLHPSSLEFPLPRNCSLNYWPLIRSPAPYPAPSPTPEMKGGLG